MAEVNETKKTVKNRKKTVWLIVAGAVLAVMLLAALALFIPASAFSARPLRRLSRRRPYRKQPLNRRRRPLPRRCMPRGICAVKTAFSVARIR